MAAITEKVYPGARNVIRLTVKEGGAAIDALSVTRITLKIGTVTIDSDAEGGTSGDIFKVEAGGVIQMRLGVAATSLPAAGTYPARLRLYDATNANGGLIWTHEDQLSDPFKIQVMAS